MSEQANKQIALEWLDAVSAGDIDTFRSTMAEDVDHQVPGTCLLSGKRTRDEVCQLLGMINAFTEDGIHLSVVNITADDDRVAVEATGTSLVKDVGPYELVPLFLPDSRWSHRPGEGVLGYQTRRRRVRADPREDAVMAVATPEVRS